MAYEQLNLNVLAYTSGYTQWHYKTDDSYEDVVTEGYFDKAEDRLCCGDKIDCNLAGCSDYAILWVKEVSVGGVFVEVLAATAETVGED